MINDTAVYVSLLTKGINMPLGYNAGDITEVNVTIASGGQLSSVGQLGSKRLAAIRVPAGWTAGTLTLYSTPNGTGSDARPVNNGAGSTKTLTVVAGEDTEVPPDFAWAFRNIQLYSSVAQGAARTLTLITREV